MSAAKNYKKRKILATKMMEPFAFAFPEDAPIEAEPISLITTSIGSGEALLVESDEHLTNDESQLQASSLFVEVISLIDDEEGIGTGHRHPNSTEFGSIGGIDEDDSGATGMIRIVQKNLKDLPVVRDALLGRESIIKNLQECRDNDPDEDEEDEDEDEWGDGFESDTVEDPAPSLPKDTNSAKKEVNKADQFEKNMFDNGESPQKTFAAWLKWQWLNEMEMCCTVELETMSILYAKSVIGLAMARQRQNSQASFVNRISVNSSRNGTLKSSKKGSESGGNTPTTATANREKGSPERIPPAKPSRKFLASKNSSAKQQALQWRRSTGSTFFSAEEGLSIFEKNFHDSEPQQYKCFASSLLSLSPISIRKLDASTTISTGAETLHQNNHSAAPSMFTATGGAAGSHAYFCPSPHCSLPTGGECSHRTSVRIRAPRILSSTTTTTTAKGNGSNRSSASASMMSSQQHGGILYRNSQGEQIDSEQVQSLNRHRLSTIDLQPMLVKQQQEREKISPNCSLLYGGELPYYRPKLQLRSTKTDKRTAPALRHSIRVNDNEDETLLTIGDELNLPAFFNTSQHSLNGDKRPTVHMPPAPSSPISSSSDSGQCSGGLDSGSSVANRSHSPDNILSSTNGETCLRDLVQQTSIGKHGAVPNNNVITNALRDRLGVSTSSRDSTVTAHDLPTYPRIANTIDRLLRTANSLYSLIGALNNNCHSSPNNSPSIGKELKQKTENFCSILHQSFGIYGASPSSYFVQRQGRKGNAIASMICAVRDVEMILTAFEEQERSIAHQHLYFAISEMLEQSMFVFNTVICDFLTECTNMDKLLVIALEHLIHLLLFGDELVLQAVKLGVVDELVKFCRMPTTPMNTLKLILRTLAVTCGISKGCLQLLSIGGLDVILHLLSDSVHGSVSVEAAGVLTNLTNPGHSFIKLTHHLNGILLRLLSLVDEAENAESLLLCVAAIANLSQQNAPTVSEILYTHNAVLRLNRALRRPICAECIFIQEQTISIFSRMAGRGYEQALVAQGAIPFLLKMVTLNNHKHIDYSRRINYKAAVCLGTIAFNGAGLKAIYENRGYNDLCEVLRREKQTQTGSPIQLICASIKQRLENRYHNLLESLV